MVHVYAQPAFAVPHNRRASLYLGKPEIRQERKFFSYDILEVEPRPFIG